MTGPEGRRQRLDTAARVDAAIGRDPGLADRIQARARRRLISLRLPIWQIDTAKRLAKHLRRPYQRLIQSWIAQGLREELRGRAGQSA